MIGSGSSRGWRCVLLKRVLLGQAVLLAWGSGPATTRGQTPGGAMRWDAPVPHSTFRFATHDIRLGDVVIPAYAQVIVSSAAANRRG